MDNDKPQQIKGLYSFRSFRLDAPERRLWCKSEQIALMPKQFDLLFYFVENAGRVATKDELLDAVWADTYVAESTLARNVSWLRKKLGECADGETLIETVPKLGYRFTPEVTRPENSEKLLVIKEKTVQHFRAEEAVTADDVLVESRGENQTKIKEEEVTNLLPPQTSFSPRLLLLSAFALVALAGIFFTVYSKYSNDNPAKAIVLTNIEHFTAATGYEDTPAFSPDGRFIVYSSANGNENAAKDIYVKAVKTGEPRQITKTEANEQYPVFSPDGLNIAFIRGKYGTPGALIIIPLLGGIEQRIARLFSGNFSISFSPDGSHIAVVDTADSNENGQYAIYLIDIKTGERRRVTAPAEFAGETTPRFSPDGKNIAFIRIAPTNDEYSINNQDMFVVPAIGGEPKQLTFDKSIINSLTWNGTGDQIFFASYRLTNQVRVWSVASTGGESAVVSTGGNDIRNMAVSPDGKKIVFSERNRQRAIWQVPSNGEPAKKLVDSSTDQFYPQFSPDGSQIAFYSYYNESVSNDYTQIWLTNSDGGNLRQITKESFPARHPQFSPDGSRIAFDMETDKESVNYIISTDGTGLRRISQEGWRDDFPVWSFDGNFIFFISKQTGEKNIWKIKSDGSGAPVQITKNGAYRAFPAPDGKFVYYIKEKFPDQFKSGNEFPEHLWRVSTQDGIEETVPQFTAAGFFGIFTTGKAGIYFLSNDSGQKVRLKLYDFADNQIKDAPGDYKIPTDIDKSLISGDVVSVNANALLYTVSKDFNQLMLADLP